MILNHVHHIANIMSIKSFTVVKPRQRRGYAPFPVVPSNSEPLWQVRQEVSPYRVEGRTAAMPNFMPQILQHCLQDMEERVVARMSAEFSRLLQAQPANLQQDEARIQQALPALPEQSARTWQIEQNAALRTQFMQQCELLSSKQVADLLGSKAKNRAASANFLKDKGKIFAVRLHGQDYFPAFQFDPLAHHCYPEMAQLISQLARDYEPGWQLALWFTGPNEWLQGQTPLALWGQERDAVLRAAKAESLAFDA